ncbi:MAG: hypothetical protein SOU84_05615 [Candidatus Faecimonas sp.]|nr:hypothetical protein [Mycoplasmatota bacterium]MDY2908612.1 hypothetical protein [Candidatus Faecimonas sp.]
MNKQCELIEKIYKDASMGRFSTEKLLGNLKDKDNKIIGDVEEIFKGYSSFEEKAKEILLSRDIPPEKVGNMTKMMSSMGIFKEVLADNSDSAIADLLIQGLLMGEVEMKKRIENASDDVNKDDFDLAKDFLKFQKKSHKIMEKYL